ncbi:hypothetical protein [Schleiferia thermophila]|uniref:Outer membrane protein beta-barrel domain-containing protein n=1 Tax=Schleiferia thermophila TaxID=884107 RepID=A0A369A3F1_9FLAO|nr:hypothetical protein [Schleiferia thermophila]KFD39805.1 hypothetical protein AT05_03175 [Schleiferia thermophila str. Yellowstone]PMB25718.1 hypothetical protein CEN47_16655 [Fischerella thermalis CCMEE 5319]RCX03850.1 hypothetical protein DES35_102306 [Schleiferia thermophila]GCD80082.1 hypothetical protein JCM30197_13290 [Schleiferia thermophila]
MKFTGCILATFYAFVLCHTAKAQDADGADYKRVVYDNDYVAGIQLHTKGYGILFRRGYYTSNFSKHGFETEVVNLRHEKEIKTFGLLPGNSRGFVLNKINSFYACRVGWFRERILYDRYDRNGIILSSIFSGGLSLGLVKPVYVEIENPESNFGQDRILVRRYNPAEPQQNILGQAGFFQGIVESIIEPGIYIKALMSFDYFGTDERINAVEFGAVADIFRRRIPILYDYVNPAVFFQLFININFGKRWN